MHEEVKKYVQNRDIKGLKYIFADCLVVDPTFEKYREDYEYCRKAPGIFEAYKELTPLEINPSRWNMEYWEKIKLDLLENFSAKRFEHMVEVARVVYADKVSRLRKERKTAEEERRRKESLAEEERRRKESLAEEERRRKESLAEQSAGTARQNPVSEKRDQTIIRESSAAAGQVHPVTYSGQNTLDAAKQQEQERLAKRKQELEAENQKAAEEERRQKERLAAQRAKYGSQNTAPGNDGIKKALGIVFAAAAVIIIALIVMKVL